MSKVIALIYADTDIPAEVYEEIRRLQDKGYLDLMDLLEIEIKDNGKLKLEREMGPPVVGHSQGLFLPALVGLIFFNAVSSANENVRKTRADISLDPQFLEEISSKVFPRNSVLFLYLRNDLSDRILGRFSQHGLKVLQMPLSGNQEDRLIKLFRGQAPGDPQHMFTSMS